MKNKSLFLTLIILISLNAVYFGIQNIDKATAIVQADSFDDLALINEQPTPQELLDLEEAYQQRLELITNSPNQIRLKLDRAIDGYPAKIVSVNYSRMYVVVDIWGWMTEGTDSSCEMASKMFHNITSLGFTLEVQGEFVPSRENPMDVAWTQYLMS